MARAGPLVRVAVVGAGPGGIAAARRLRERARDTVEVTLFEREPAVEYLPGTVQVLLGHAPRDRFRVPVSLAGVEGITANVRSVSGHRVTTDAGEHPVDAVIAAPGLALDVSRLSGLPSVHPLWDPAGAEAASQAALGLADHTVAVVISSVPYRCPPAPFGMAMELAAQHPDARVVLSTPEEVPLAAVGGGVPEFLARSCVGAGVEVLPSFVPDLEALGSGVLRSADGIEVAFDLAFVVPPHVRSPLLADLPGQGPLVPVSPRFETAERDLFVVGDAAMVPLPRAADVAAAGGRTAADAVLERLGSPPEPHLPAPDCYIGHGGGVYSRISLRYPHGLPPAASATVEIGGPSEGLVSGQQAAFEAWRRLRDERPSAKT